MEQHFQHIKRIFKGQEYPKTICISYSLKMLAYLGQWNLKQASRAYKTYFNLINVLIVVHFCSLIWDLCEIYNDFILFGDSMCVAAGVGLVIYKKYYHNYYSVNFDEVFEQLKSFNRENDKKDGAIRNLLRKYFIEEYILTISTIFLGISLIIALCGHSLFDSSLPLRAKYPMGVNSTEQFIVFTLFQVTMCFYLIEGIVFIDGIGGQVMSQISLQFHILSLEFQRIGHDLISTKNDDFEKIQTSAVIKINLHDLIKRHQHLMEFAKRVSALYQPMLLAQLACSLSMLCLTAFEATLTMHDIFLFMKFAVYAISVLIQILYWCYYGNRVSHMSTTINESIIECNWIATDTIFKKDLMLTMMRAQKPFQFKVYGYFPMSYDTFISVLSRSYSLFTLFRTVSD